MPLFEIEANGKLYEVEAPTMEAAANAAKQFAAPQPKEQVEGAFAPSKALQQGLSLGLSDELAGAARSFRGIPEALKTGSFDPIKKAYLSGQQEEEGRIDAYKRENPKSALAQELLGGVVSLGGTGGTKTLQSLNPYLRAGVEGAGVGAVSGFGMADQDKKLEGAGLGAATGAALGPATRAIGEGAGKIIGAFGKKEPVPTLESLKQQAGRLYDKADDIGLVVSKNSVQNLLGDISETMKKEGFHPRIQKDIAVALKELETSAADDLTLRELQNLREIAQAAGGSLKPSERRLSRMMVGKLDDYLDNLSGQDVVAGDAQAASDLLKGAKGLWARKRKGDLIAKIFKDAEVTAGQYSISGPENAIRTGFRQLAKNEKLMRGFTAEEQAAIRQVATGTLTGNTLRVIGKLAPNGLNSIYGLLAGIGTMNPWVTAGVYGTGAAAKAGAAASTSRNARLADELVRRGYALSPSAAQRLGAEGVARGLLQLTPGAVAPGVGLLD